MHIPSSLGGNDCLHDDKTLARKQRRLAIVEIAGTQKGELASCYTVRSFASFYALTKAVCIYSVSGALRSWELSFSFCGESSALGFSLRSRVSVVLWSSFRGSIYVDISRRG